MEFDENIINNFGANLTNPKITTEMLDAMNLGIAEGFCRNGDIEDGMALYKKTTANNLKLRNIITKDFNEKLRLLAKEFYKKKKYTNALIQYKRLIKLIELNADEYLIITNCLIELGQNKIAIEFLYKYIELATDQKIAFGNAAEILGLKLEMYPEAISFMEKYIAIESKNALAYNTLGHFYSKYYNDKYLDKQLEYFLKANELNPNNQIYVRNIIFASEKIGDATITEKFYKKLLKLNPTELDYNYYGCFLIQQGNLKDGYKYLESRFFAPEVILEYPQWLDVNKRAKPDTDLTNKTLLLFHEGGYGDSIMYARFIEQLKTKTKKILLFMPDKLISLFKSSGIDVEMYPMTHDLTEFDYDYNASLVDLPYILEAMTDSLPYPEGYLRVSQEKISQYKKAHLKDSNKLKIGISYCANPKYQNATKRDAPLEAFYPLTKLKNAEIYSLQVADEKQQIKNLPKDVNIIDLGPTFKNFEDSSAAIMNMDLIITIDNVILNLAGALGVKTMALYNRFPEYRWFKTTGEDVGWYNSVKPFVAKNFNGWDELIQQIISEIKYD